MSQQPQIRLKAQYTLDEAKAATADVLDIIDGLDYQINQQHRIEIDPNRPSMDRLVAERTRKGLEAQRRGYTTLLARIERRIIETLLRYTVVLTGMVVHGDYYSALAQAWMVDPSKQEKERLEVALLDELVEFIGDFVGYPPSELWFDLNMRRESTGWQETDIKRDIHLKDTYYEAIEDENGKVIRRKTGGIDEL